LFTEPRRVETVADLFANVWQYGYVTTDLDRALEMLGQRFGLEHCITVDTAGSSFMVGDEPRAGRLHRHERRAGSPAGGLPAPARRP
jgi:hypothetical protein